MVANLPRRVGRGGNSGGNNHPIAVKQFIRDHLARVGEDYIAGIHQAYCDALDQLAIENHGPGGFFYHHPVYESIVKKVRELTSDGTIEFSGHEEPSDHPNFACMTHKPMRRYYRLVKR